MARFSFTDHPNTVGESYGEHLGVATRFGFAMIGGGLACLVHGLLPFLFTTTGSRTVRALYDRMVANRRGAGRAPAISRVPQDSTAG